MSDRVSVLSVADSDELWELHARALRRAGMFLNDEDASQAMRALWIDGRFRAEPGNLSSLDLSRADRRLLVAWTWPNPWGVAASTQDVFDRVRSRAQNVSPDPAPVWAEEVRLRVGDVVRRLNTWDVREGLGVLWAASGLFKDDAAAQERLLALKHGAEPLVAQWLLDLSHRGTLVFDEQFTDLGAWAFDGVALRAALAARDDIAGVAGALSKVFTSRRDLAHLRLDAERVLAGLAAIHVYDPREFHEQLPRPPGRGLKFSRLFTFLDMQQGATRLSVERISKYMPSERPAGTRGPFKPGLPLGASKPQWWVNPRPGEHAALGKFPQARAWLAAGMIAHPETVGADRRVVAVRFDVLPDRHRWWHYRGALRAGTFTPWEQIGPKAL